MDDKLKQILDSLNEEQREAVRCTDGAVLIVAGAGSGKTRVLTSRIAYLLARGTEPSAILALTFTKKAATEMKERIAMMVGRDKARRLVMGTFHSVFVRFLREYAGSIGYPSNFTIYDTSDSISAVKTCLKEMELSDKSYKPRDVLSRISKAKNNLITPDAYLADPAIAQADARTNMPKMGMVYLRYQQKLKAAGVMDFDDILLNTNNLLRDDKAALADIADRFTHIMVDEYQDTNRSQYIILRRLSMFRGNICVVGDDSQSIYAFRGAKIENILNFKKDYPLCRVFRLERNYRSTKTIVEAANSLIAHNEGRIPKNCYSEAESGEKIRIITAGSEQEEGARLASEIMMRMRSENASYRDFAILYRTNSQSRVIEEHLRRRNIPYMIYSGNSFFDRAEVKDFMAYFKLCVNPHDDESFKRAVGKPSRGIGATTLEKLAALAAGRRCSLFEAGQELPKVKVFCDMIAALSSQVRSSDAQELARRIADDSGLYAFYKADTSMEGQARMSNVDELINSVAEFVEQRQEEAEEAGSDDRLFTLDDYLENVSLLSNADTDDGDGSKDKVALMTVHSAKGLEFPYVFVAGMEDNLFPSLSMLSSSRDVEEERRLFYVAVTRAEKALTLSLAQTRMRNGRHESNSPSRFIGEIDSRYYENPLSREDYAAFGEFAPRSYGAGRDFEAAVRFRAGGGFGGGSRNGSGGFGGFGGGRSERSTGRVQVGSGAFSRGGSATGNAGRPAAAGRTFPPAGAARPEAGAAKAPVREDFEAADMRAFTSGQRVEHNRFGFGTITQLSGKYPDIKAVIDFDAYGTKILLLKYAKLRPAE